MMQNDFYSKALELDSKDPLASYRDRFVFQDAGIIYLDGNSLGRLPRESKDLLERSVQDEWGERLIRSWNDDWYTKNLELGDKIARIVGASEGEVVVTDTTSVNLYKLAYAALKFKEGKTTIVTDDLNFPSDLYILEGLVKELGEKYTLKIVSSRDGIGIQPEELIDAVNEDTALVSLSHVVFKSAYRYPMKEITQKVQQKGALMLWDLSHSAGAVPGELNDSGADLAVGCTYKYLNGGPGSPAFLYVRKDLQEQLLSPIWGWFGEQNPFDFTLQYRPGQGIRRFLTGTPPILSMKAMEPTVDMMNEVGMDRIREKSERQSAFLIEMAEAYLYPLGFKPGSPGHPADRGSHLSFRHPEAYRLCKALIDPGVGQKVVIPDFREPDNIRIGITPLYTTYEEIYHAMTEIRTIMGQRDYESYSKERVQVT